MTFITAILYPLMNKIISQVVLCLALSFPICVSAQDHFFSYEAICYIDNLRRPLYSDILDSLYYSSLTKRQFQGTVRIDPTLEQSIVRVQTKRAKDGFLFLQEYISKEIEAQGSIKDTMNVFYMYNHAPVKTKRDVKRLLRLRKRNLHIQLLVIDNERKRVIAYISDHELSL